MERLSQDQILQAVPYGSESSLFVKKSSLHHFADLIGETYVRSAGVFLKCQCASEVKVNEMQ